MRLTSSVAARWCLVGGLSLTPMLSQAASEPPASGQEEFTVPEDSFRVWHSRRGTPSSPASLVQANDDVAIFQFEDGRRAKAPLALLSDEDRRLILDSIASTTTHPQPTRGLPALPVSFNQPAAVFTAFPQAVGALEIILAKNAVDINQVDIGTMDRVLNFVRNQLPNEPREAPGEPAGPGCVRFEWRQVWSGGCWGRRHCRWMCVRVPCQRGPGGKRGAEAASSSVLRDKIDQLATAIVTLNQATGVNLNDLARQVYGVTLSVDNISQPGRIARQ